MLAPKRKLRATNRISQPLGPALLGCSSRPGGNDHVFEGTLSPNIWLWAGLHYVGKALGLMLCMNSLVASTFHQGEGGREKSL